MFKSKSHSATVAEIFLPGVYLVLTAMVHSLEWHRSARLLPMLCVGKGVLETE